MVVCIKCPLLRHPLCPCLVSEAIPIPADQPIMQIRDLEEVTIPTMEIKVKYNLKTYRERELCCFQTLYKVLLFKCYWGDPCLVYSVIFWLVWLNYLSHIYRVNRWIRPVVMKTWWLSGPSCHTIIWPEESTCPRSSTASALTAKAGDSWSK